MRRASCVVRRVAVVCGLWSVVCLAGCGPETISRDWHRIDPPVPAPGFTLPMLDGGTLSLSELKGKVVVMEFWATWCGPCRSSLPSLEVIYRRYKNRGMTILLINEGEEIPPVRAWLGKRFTAPVLLDRQTEVGSLYRVHGIPRLFVIDQEGRVAFAHEGYGGGLERNLKLVLEELLAGKVPPHG